MDGVLGHVFTPGSQQWFEASTRAVRMWKNQRRGTKVPTLIDWDMMLRVYLVENLSLPHTICLGQHHPPSLFQVTYSPSPPLLPLQPPLHKQQMPLPSHQPLTSNALTSRSSPTPANPTVFSHSARSSSTMGS